MKKNQKQKYKLIAIDGTIVDTFVSKYSAQTFRSYYYKMCGELLEIQEIKEGRIVKNEK